MKRIFIICCLVVFGVMAVSLHPPTDSPMMSRIETTSGWAIGNYTCTFPSANDSAYLLGVGSPDSPSEGYEIYNDGLTWYDLYATTVPRAAAAYTTDFNGSTYYGFPAVSLSNLLPPPGAIITSVGLVAIFAPPGYGLPGGYSMVTDWEMAYSKNVTPDYISVGAPSPVAFFTYSNQYYYIPQLGLEVNVTAAENWTTEMLASHDFSVRLTFTVPEHMTFYLDYLGVQYSFYVPPSVGYGGEGSSAPWPTPEFSPPDFNTWMWAGGLAGMFITAPLAVYLYRNADNRFGAFIGVIVFGAICFVTFMTGIGI